MSWHDEDFYDCSFDGAVEPINPGGTGSFGAVIRRQGRVIFSKGAIIRDWPGVMTNNVAEYYGLLKILEALESLHPDGKVIIRGDSQLVICQMNRRWRIGKGHYAPLARAARDFHSRMKNSRIFYEWVPRERNEEADILSKQCLMQAGICPRSRTGRPLSRKRMKLHYPRRRKSPPWATTAQLALPISAEGR